MEEALRALLLGAAPIATRVERRIDWGLRPQGKPLPAITLAQINGSVGMTYSGPSGWSQDRVQIDCWGRTFKDARDLADAIAARGGLLVRFRGDRSGVRLRTSIITRRSGTDTDGENPVHRASIDVAVWHTPTE